jgi:hypothetical protein
MDRLEERVGPKGRKLFEQFLQKVNRLEEQQLLQERQQQEQPQRKQPTVSPSGGPGGDPIERALAIAARYGSTTDARQSEFTRIANLKKSPRHAVTPERAGSACSSAMRSRLRRDNRAAARFRDC